MGLKPGAKLISITSNASVINIGDNTGAYSGTNTGGFGAPNPEQGDITGAIIRGTNYGNLATYTGYRVPSVASLFTLTGLPLSPSLFGGGSVFEDGVWDFRYDLCFAGAGSITFTAGSKQFSLASADTIFANADGFVLAGNTSKVYFIDRTQPLTNSGGYVTEVLPGTGSPSAYEVFYEGSLKILVDKAGCACLDQDIAEWAVDGCDETTQEALMFRFKKRIAMKHKFSKAYYSEAHNLAVSLAADCGTQSTSCGCS